MIHAIAAAALLLAQTAPAGQCLTRAEAADVMATTVPYMVDAVARKCAAALPANAFLRTGSAPLIQRLRAESAGRPATSGAIGKIFGSDMPAEVRPETLAQLFGEAMAGEMVKDVKSEDCPEADRLVAALAPLPAANLGSLVVTFIEFGNGKEGDPPFPICDARP